MIKKIFLSVILVTLVLFASPINNINAQESIKEIDISTSPHKVFFDISNAKPGDEFTKILKIQNNGTKDFKYLFSSHFITGSKRLYNELDLIITDTSKEIYRGKLKDYERVGSRIIRSNKNEELTYKIYFPIGLGNDFQSLSCEFQFKFYVEGTLGGLIPPNGPKLPETGTQMFNIMATGLVLFFIGALLIFVKTRRRRTKSDI